MLPGGLRHQEQRRKATNRQRSEADREVVPERSFAGSLGGRSGQAQQVHCLWQQDASQSSLSLGYDLPVPRAMATGACWAHTTSCPVTF